jgi:insertion element IS1 protein InsB
MGMRVGKHTDDFLLELLVTTEGKTDCQVWYTDDWGGYERILPPEVIHITGKENTQRLERTNGIIGQQTGRWHRRQNKFGKVWSQTKVVARLAIGYFNWIWQHSRCQSTAAQRAGLAANPWSWHDFATYPTFC